MTSRPSHADEPSGPTFLVAGAARAGTTGLLAALRDHPDVFVTVPKEPHYLALHGTVPAFRGPGDDTFVNRVAVTDERGYRDLFRPGRDRPARGEGSVSTLYYHERAVPEMLRLDPQMRVVLLLREPVSRAYSAFQYLTSLGLETEEDFLAAVSDEPRRVAGDWHHLWHYTAMSRYADGIVALRDALPDEHLGVWFHEDLESDFHGTLASVTEFLGLRPHGDADDDVQRINASGSLQFPRAQRALWWATRRPALRRVVRTTTSYRFREAIRARMMKRSGVPAAAYEALAPRFADDVARLREVLPDLVGNRPLPAWLIASAAGDAE